MENSDHSNHQALHTQRKLHSGQLWRSYCQAEKITSYGWLYTKARIPKRKTDFLCMNNIYLSHVSAMSLVVLQLFPTWAPHSAGCISPLRNQKETYIRQTNKESGNYLKKSLSCCASEDTIHTESRRWGGQSSSKHES